MPDAPTPGLFARLGLALVLFFRILFRPTFAQRMLPYRRLPTGAAPAPGRTAAPPPARFGAAAPPESALVMLGALQREGRFIDFLQEEVAGFSDAEVGAAARVVHAGCRKVLGEHLALEPVLPQAEGAQVTVPPGFDARQIRLTGNVHGAPPFFGALKHHGWVTRSLTLPDVSDAVDPRVLAPAEVELS